MPTRIVTGNGALRRRRPRAATSADIVERITRAITEHRLPPGTKLTEERLGEAFRVSRTKVRQALFHLAKDKLVDLQTGRGAYVAQPTVREAHEIFDARRLIERGIVARLAGALVPAQLARLRKHLDEEARALASGDVRASTRLSGQFHVLIAEMTGNGALAEVLRELVSRTSLIIVLYESSLPASCSMDEHRMLLKRIEGGDAKTAAQAMAEHLDNIERSLNLRDRQPAVVNLKRALS
jgi:DNA-binding GntR family transcriptional regulator